MLTVERLTKRYGKKTVVEHISFSVKQGDILGFLGPNGAGKSTTMNMLAGYLGADEGSILIDGTDMMEAPLAAKKKIGYLPEKPPLYPEMTVKEYLCFVFRIKGLKGAREECIKEACCLAHIEDVSGRLIRNLSKGYQQRVGLAQALLGSPPLLILDEPTAGLDPKQIIEIRELIADLGKKTTILLSSHILSEIQAVCSRVLVMDHGRILADGSTESITGSGNKLRVTVKGNFQDARAALESLPGVLVRDAYTESEPGVFEFMLEHERGADIRTALFEALAQHRMPIYALREGDRSLEEVFLALTQGENDGGAQ